MTNCSSNFDYRSKILGNWKSCSKDGIYFEAYISDSITFQFNFQGIHQTYSYKMLKDTFQYSVVGYDNSQPTITNSLTVTFKDDSNMIWEASQSHEKWTFKRIAEQIKLPSLTEFDLESLKHYEKEKAVFINRASTYKCVDKRTPGEIYQDSVNSSFKF